MTRRDDVAKVADVFQMPGCMCGPLRCEHCGKKVHANGCAELPPNLNACPHCGYPTKSVSLSREPR